MVRIGITGLGFMGKMHFRCYKNMPEVEVVAICDVDPGKFDDSSAPVGNIEGAQDHLDLSGIALYNDFGKMLSESRLDAVSITLPTYMHKDHTLQAFKAGVHVLCEKPMALNEKECDAMIAAAEAAGKRLQIGHCIRFWPEYAKAKEIVQSGEYGPVKAATFQRVASTPTWSWDNWLMQKEKSQGAILDLHIHDTDFVQYLLGMPRAVFSSGTKGPSGGIDHIYTQFLYDKGPAVFAEGGWLMEPGFGFSMSFQVILEEASVVFNCNKKPTLQIFPHSGGAIDVELPQTDGYVQEIKHFIRSIQGETVPEILTPQQSKDSVRLVHLELKSLETGNVTPV